jgi:hypothetical protein
MEKYFFVFKKPLFKEEREREGNGISEFVADLAFARTTICGQSLMTC